jgi:hypothetical protein
MMNDEVNHLAEVSKIRYLAIAMIAIALVACSYATKLLYKADAGSPENIGSPTACTAFDSIAAAKQ